MAPVALGFRAHTGWAAAVALAGPPDAPAVVDRRRLELAQPGLPVQVYHAARPLGVEEAQALVRRATEAAQEMADHVIRGLIVKLRSTAGEVVGCGVVLGSGLPVSTVEKALSSHAGRHAAEGEMYRQALIQASEACGLPVTGATERSLYTGSAATLSMSVDELRQRIAELGEGLGPPWGQDQKGAALVAWLALAAALPPSQKRVRQATGRGGG